MLLGGSHVRLLAAGARRVIWFVNAGRGFHDMAGSLVPGKQGLYDPANEKDSCGACSKRT